eukprot:COSAG02_NODE_19709_length_868_cov_1.133940_1_plen_67_part_10
MITISRSRSKHPFFVSKPGIYLPLSVSIYYAVGPTIVGVYTAISAHRLVELGLQFTCLFYLSIPSSS